MTAKEHGKLLSIFLLVQGGLQLFGGVVVALLYGGIGAAMLSAARRSNDRVMGSIFIVSGVVVGVICLLTAAVALLSGWKMLKNKPGARTWSIVACCVALLGFPLGTALGIYGLWFLFSEQGKQFYAGNGQTGYQTPPPPHNWQ